MAVGLSGILRHPSVRLCRLASYQLGANLFSAPDAAVPTQQQHHGYQRALCLPPTLLWFGSFKSLSKRMCRLVLTSLGPIFSAPLMW